MGFSEEMDTLFATTFTIRYSDGNTRKLRPLKSSWSADGRSLVFQTSTQPLGQTPKADTVRLLIDARDLSGNPLDTDPTTISHRDGTGNWIDNNPGVDANHRLVVAIWNLKISGVVQSGAKKIQKATIDYYRDNRFVGRAGSGVGGSLGRFSSDRLLNPILPPGGYKLFAFKKGFGPAFRDLGFLETGETFVTMNLTAEGVVSGVVRRSSDSAPVGDVGIVARHKLPGIDTPVELDTVTSSSNGAYRIGSLPTGAVTAVLSRSGYDTTTVSLSAEIGKTKVRDILIKPHPGGIRAIVRRALNGDSLSGVKITVVGTNLLAGSGFPGSKKKRTRRNGAAAISGLGPALYVVTASLKGFVPDSRVNISVNPDTETVVTFLLLKKARYTLKVTDARGRALSGVHVTISGSTKKFKTGPGGFVVIRGVPPGTYTVSLTKTLYVPTSFRVVLGDGERKTETKVLPKFGSLSGHVENALNAQAIPSAAILLMNGADRLTATSDGAGDFTIKNVKPGSYTLSATANGFAPVSGTKVIGDGEAAKATIVMIPTGEITGSVTDQTGAALGGVTISAGGQTTTSRTDGGYLLKRVPFGSQVVTASRSGYKSSGPVTVTVSATPATANFRMTALPGRVSGTVNVKADVHLSGIGWQTGTRFDFANVPHGNYTLSADAAGYASVSRGVFVNPGQHVRVSLTLTKNKTGEIEANVYKVNGNKDVVHAQHVPVTVSGPGFSQTKNTGWGINSGKVVFFKVPAGRYQISAIGQVKIVTVTGGVRVQVIFLPK